jgi:hypothetical protein
MAVTTTTTLVADSSLSFYLFLVGLGCGLSHGHDPEAVLSALPSSLCRRPWLR